MPPPIRWTPALILAATVSLPARQVSAHVVCIDIDLGDALLDASPESGEPDFGEDFGRDEGSNPFPTSAWLYRILDHDTPTKVLSGWAPLSASGCTEDFDRDGADAVDVLFLPWAYFTETNNSVIAYDCESMPDCSHDVALRDDIDVSGSSPTRFTLGDPLDPSDPHAERGALWAAAFAQQRYGATDDLAAFVSVDTNGTLFTDTASNRVFGGQPSSVFAGNGARFKWNIAHEYGHLVSFVGPIAALATSDIDCSFGGSGHALDSIEYQSCACAEGFANYFSAVTWTEPGTNTSTNLPYVSVGSGSPPNPIPSFIGGNTICGPSMSCGAANPGRAVERDWAGALLQLSQAADLTVEYVLGMLAAAHPWTTTGLTGAFWSGFDSDMSSYLTSTEKDEWDDQAQLFVIDQ